MAREPMFRIIQSADADALAESVSNFIHAGWKLHGELHLQTIADPSSSTMVRLVYIQAVVRYGIALGYD